MEILPKTKYVTILLFNQQSRVIHQNHRLTGLSFVCLPDNASGTSIFNVTTGAQTDTKEKNVSLNGRAHVMAWFAETGASVYQSIIRQWNIGAAAQKSIKV
jgi:hypothetical protein